MRMKMRAALSVSGAMGGVTLSLFAVLLCCRCLLSQPAYALSTASDDGDAAPALDKRVSLPARIASVEELFAALAQNASVRIIAPAQSTETLLAKLNESFSSRTLSVREVLRIYGELSGLRWQQAGSLQFFESPPKGLSLAPTSSLSSAITLAGFELIGSLTHEQVDQMYANDYVTTAWLTSSQRRLYVDFVRKSQVFDDFTKPAASKLGEEAILKLPVRLFFSYCASFEIRKPDGSETDWIGAYDYGRGLLRYPPNPKRDKPACVDAGVNPLLMCPDLLGVEPSQQKPVEISKTQVVTLKDAAGLMAKAGRDLQVDRRLQEMKIVITKGTYSVEELMKAIPLTTGTSVRSLGGLLFLAGRDRDIAAQREKELDQVAAKVQKPLQRLRLSEAVPFFRSVFVDRTTVAFSRLDETEQEFIRERLQNDLAREKLDLGRCEVSFAETIWFEGFFGDPTTPGAEFFTFQIW